mmetsp:Transcript_8206/g.18332  ORF Transcript_8206/g.18332 Transcript_8206/m.18332 type:complete len:164 (-) Transcript_8206:417-908(-)
MPSRSRLPTLVPLHPCRCNPTSRSLLHPLRPPLSRQLSSGSSCLRWFSQGTWFVGPSKLRGRSVGLFAVRDGAVAPELITHAWKIARLLPKATTGTSGAKRVRNASSPRAEFVEAPDLRCLGGAQGRAALNQFLVERSIAASRSSVQHQHADSGRRRSTRLRG